MSRRAKVMLVAMLVASPLVGAPSALASGGASGGASAAPASGSVGAVPGIAQAASLFTTASGDGITVTTEASGLLGRDLTFTGTTSTMSAGNTILVQRLDPQAGWVSIATGPVNTAGVFSVVWQANYVGQMTVRTVLEQGATTSQAGPTAPSLQLTVYQAGIATYYGKGFFGQRTACGMILRRATLGVASRTLKCGTPVQIYYGGRTIVVPVIDRGPYANHARWDLTQATARALGMFGTEIVGAMPV